MTLNDLQKLTVLQLRKVAKENHVVLGSGIDKAGIIDKILSVLPEDNLSDVQDLRSESDSVIPDEEPQQDTSAPAAPKYQAAWHNTAVPRFNARPAYQAPGSFGAHPAWQSTTPSGRQLSQEQRVQPMRPGTSAPRFGPASAARPVAPSEQVIRNPQENIIHTPVSPLPERRFGPSETTSFGPGRQPSYTAAYTPSVHVPESAPASPSPVDSDLSSPTLEELLASGDYEIGEGILELHPDGYGFLRSSNYLPSSRDVYVSMAQIRRFGLRTGDMISGKVRPQREGDKYAALLYINTVNGVSEEEAESRPLFDELTPAYPSRRISLESKDGKSLPDMRLVDLIAPIGYGQRALLLCPPNTGKMDLMRHMASVIGENDPNVSILMLLIDVNPEDVTFVRDSVSCPVLASTFDQTPEAHLRLSEIVLERAMRLVEQKKDVVLLVDSLTRLAKVYTTAAAQQGRSLPGMVNPASLFRAKRLFGAARACKEGGSLTVIAAMDISTGSKVDDSIVEEFKGTANMELTLDLAVARAGVSPAINLFHSFTKNSDILLDQRQKEGLSLIRTMLGNTSSAVAIPQLESMMEKAATNAELLLKMKDWFALMNR